MKFKAMQLGYKVRGCNIRYHEPRKQASRNSLRRHYFWGRATSINGQPLLIALTKALRDVRHRPYFLASTVFLLSYLAHRVAGHRPFGERYYGFVNTYFNMLVKRGVLKRWRRLTRWI